MAEMLDKGVQQEPAVAESAQSATLAPEESRYVEMTDAQPAKAPEEAPAAPVEAPKAKAAEVSNALPDATAPKEEPKPAENVAPPVEPPNASAAPDNNIAPAVEDKPASETPEKPAEKPVEDQAKKTEAAEDASVKMLAANLEPSTNGKTVEETKEPAAEAPPKDSAHAPVTGEKRKADEVVDTNGDASNKKHEIENPVRPAQTNGTAPRKVGRPKKDKKAPAPVGRTARRTRSQGAPEA